MSELVHIVSCMIRGNPVARKFVPSGMCVYVIFLPLWRGVVGGARYRVETWYEWGEQRGRRGRTEDGGRGQCKLNV